MDKPFWLFNDSTDEYTSYIYEIIGKALMICTRFESYCKHLELLLNIKTGLTTGEEVLSEFNLRKLSDEIYKKRLFDNIKTLPLEKESNALLISAKNIRNEIVHEITKGIDDPDLPAEELSKLEEDFKKKIEKILYAEYQLVVAVCIITNDHIPNDNYITSNLKWVFYEDYL